MEDENVILTRKMMKHLEPYDSVDKQSITMEKALTIHML